MPELRELTTDEEWERAIPILRQLWSHREESFVRSWRKDEAYRLFGWFVEGDGPAGGSGTASGDGTADDDGTTGGDRAEDETLVAVAGIYEQVVIHHERGCWVHDLVVDEAHRGEGHGEALLDALDEWADERDCAHVALVCAADNDEAAAFYEHVGMETFGTVYETEL